MHPHVPTILTTVLNCGFQDLREACLGKLINRCGKSEKRYLPCVDTMPFYSLPSIKIILDFLAGKLASGLGHTICNVFDILMNSEVIRLIKKLGKPVSYNQHIDK